MKLQDTSLLRQQCYIDGQWVDADSKRALDVVNPASGEKLGTVPNAGAAEARRAIEAAARAFPAWAARTAKDRGAILPAGRDGTAYLFMPQTGRFDSTTYYLKELPAWVASFNRAPVP